MCDVLGDVMTTLEVPLPIGKFVLWRRDKRGRPWEPIEHADDEYTLTGLIRMHPSGDYITLPAGTHPEEPKVKK